MASRFLSFTGVIVCGLLAGASDRGDASARRTVQPLWTEIQWPFPTDPWGKGKAFRCDVADCGSEVTVFIRPKIGFCNCTVGVADDDEIDRVGDVVLLSEKYRPLAPGKTVTMVELPGRARHFAVGEQEQPRAFAVGIAVASKCDAVVATVASVRPIDERVERAAITMLSGGAVRRWVENVVGL